MADNIKKYSNPKKLNDVEKRVDELMSKYHNCAQCTLLALQEISGLNDDGVTKASSGLAGGIGGTQSVCGALTGGALALGLRYGRDVSYLKGPTEIANQQQGAVIEQVARLVKWFEKEFTRIDCKDLRKSFTGVDLNMDVPWQREWADKLAPDKCNQMASKTARRVLAMMDDPNLDITKNV